jgi:hypothetical protein
VGFQVAGDIRETDCLAGVIQRQRFAKRPAQRSKVVRHAAAEHQRMRLQFAGQAREAADVARRTHGEHVEAAATERGNIGDGDGAARPAGR